jgi:hypothetical protein
MAANERDKMAFGVSFSELVDDCKNKRYMINFLDESRGRPRLNLVRMRQTS